MDLPKFIIKDRENYILDDLSSNDEERNLIMISEKEINSDKFKYDLFHLLLTKYSHKTKAMEQLNLVSATSGVHCIISFIRIIVKLKNLL